MGGLCADCKELVSLLWFLICSVPVLDSIMAPPKDDHIWIPGTWEYVTLYGQREFAEVIKALEMGRSAWSSSRLSINTNIRVSGRMRQRQENQGNGSLRRIWPMAARSWWRKGPRAKVSGQLQKPEEQTDPPLRPLQRGAALQTRWSQPTGAHFRLLTSRNVK